MKSTKFGISPSSIGKFFEMSGIKDASKDCSDFSCVISIGNGPM